MPEKKQNKPKNKHLLKKVILFEAGLIVLITTITLVLVLWYWPRQNINLPEQAQLPVLDGNAASEEGSTALLIPDTLPTAQADFIEFPIQSVDEILMAPTATPLAPGEAPPQPVCGGPTQMLILAIGIDSRANNYISGLSDAMRVVRVDFVNPRVTVVALPRDLWVEIPGISDHKEITHGKLNQAYFYGLASVGYYDGPKGAPGLLMETLELNFDVKAENYVTLNMHALENIIDAVDGIDVYVPYNVDGKSTLEDDPFDLGYFERGYHHFDGATAVSFGRIRLIDNDFQRSNRQSIVLYGLQEKILSPWVLPHIPQLILTFLDAVKTDLSANQMRQLTCLAPMINRNNLVFANLPRSMFSEGRVFSPQYNKELSVVEADYDVMRQLLDLFQKGFWPQ